MKKIQKYAKFIVAILGAAVTAGAGLIPDDTLNWIAFAAAILTAVGVYAVPNKDDTVTRQ